MGAPEVTNILIVDDLPEKLLVYRSFLDELGQNVVTARSGEEALKAVLKDEFAVILLDVNMPGMDGFETAALIRKRKKSAHTPIIFLTAFSDELRAAEGYAHGAVDFITTPVVPQILQAKVKVFVDLYRMTQEVTRQARERIAYAEERTKREAAEESNRRLEFLAHAGVVLGQSLDFEVTLEHVVKLAVPALADLAIIAHAEPAQTSWSVPRANPDYGISDLPADLVAAVDSIFVGESNRPLNNHALALTLRFRGHDRYVLGIARGPTRKPFSDADRTVADAFASRAGIALENARLYRDVEHADRQKNEFLSMLAHELRNPLAPIRNAAEVIHLRSAAQPDVARAREMIDRQIAHMVRLVDDLLDVSRITRGKIHLKPTDVDLGVLLEHVIEGVKPTVKAAEHVLTVELPAERIRVHGDPDRLAQVFTNLLNNAVKYTPPGGRISVTLERSGNEAVVRIRDTGIGIPPSMLSSVFELFTQVDRSLDRAKGGLGLGLTLVQRLVSLHGGTVSAHSDGLDRGSIFSVRFPAISVETPVPPATTPHPVAPSSGKTLKRAILLVDDNVDAAESMAVLLQISGHDVRLAHDGPTALAVALEHPPDVVVLDIGLPGMDGYEVARRLRSEPATRGAILVAVTGYGRDEDRQRAIAAGFDHHLTKPAEYTAVLNLIHPVARSRPAPVVTG